MDFKLLSDYLLALLYVNFPLPVSTVKLSNFVVTFFWNGNRSGCFTEYVEIPSEVGITFNVQPKMKALGFRYV